MRIEKKEKYILITSEENTLKDFQDLFLNTSNDFETENLILHISDTINSTAKEFLLFLDIAAQKQLNGKSFVVVNSNLNVDDFPENLNITPTLQEAEDILEMENIERELGF